MFQAEIEAVKEDTQHTCLDLCQDIADNRQIIASCLYGPLISGYGDEKSDINLLVILSGFTSQLKTYKRSLEKRKAVILAVDRSAFQKDVTSGWFGEIAADKLLIPYESCIDADYLWHQEVALKKRIIWELLEALILEYPELSHEILVKQEYFMHETMMQRARLFQPVIYRFLNIMENDLKKKNTDLMMKGYKKALEELAQEKWITVTADSMKIQPRLIRAVKSRKIRIPVFLRSIQRSTVLHVLSALPRMMTPLTEEERLYGSAHKKTKGRDDIMIQLEDPKEYLLVSTPLGPVPLSDETTIEEFLRKTVPGGVSLKFETRQIGGVLNSVYLLKLQKDGQEQKIVVKKFRDWTSFKWFPLTIWAIGTKSFAMLGKSRLEREYALNQFLQNQHFAVPKVLYVSPKQSLIFQEFVEGKSLAEIIRNVVSTIDPTPEELELIERAGRRIAEVHLLGVALGDCKPENIIVTKNGELCFVDLEQGTRDGNQPWDIAEFLYYSGHYAPPFAATEKMELFARTFISGYVKAGGKPENIRKAASPRYTKVFSIFTQPQITLAIANLCSRVK